MTKIEAKRLSRLKKKKKEGEGEREEEKKEEGKREEEREHHPLLSFSLHLLKPSPVVMNDSVISLYKKQYCLTMIVLFRLRP